jgi:hypothetical protein
MQITVDNFSYVIQPGDKIQHIFTIVKKEVGSNEDLFGVILSGPDEQYARFRPTFIVRNRLDGTSHESTIPNTGYNSKAIWEFMFEDGVAHRTTVNGVDYDRGIAPTPNGQTMTDLTIYNRPLASGNKQGMEGTVMQYQLFINDVEEIRFDIRKDKVVGADVSDTLIVGTIPNEITTGQFPNAVANLGGMNTFATWQQIQQEND